MLFSYFFNCVCACVRVRVCDCFFPFGITRFVFVSFLFGVPQLREKENKAKNVGSGRTARVRLLDEWERNRETGALSV